MGGSGGVQILQTHNEDLRLIQIKALLTTRLQRTIYLRHKEISIQSQDICPIGGTFTALQQQRYSAGRSL